MIGLEGAAGRVKDLLAEFLPDKVAELRVRLDLADDELDAPEFYAAEDRPQIDLNAWPAVLVVGQDDRTGPLVDLVDGQAVYAITYRLRIFEFVRGQDFEETALTRNRLHLAIRETLLERVGLGADDTRLNPATMRSSYSDVAEDPEAGRSIAGSFIECEVTIDEMLTRTGPQAATTVVEGHPALDI